MQQPEFQAVENIPAFNGSVQAGRLAFGARRHCHLTNSTSLGGCVAS